MGPSASLRQLLRSLCQSTLWEYAVFWKLSHRGCMMLTWEEGYCQNSKRTNHWGKPQSDKLYDDASSAYELDLHSFHVSCPVGPAVSRMSSHMYSLGNGVIGTVAYTGKHQWLLFSELNSKLLGEYPDEWQLQFDAGIKTILLVPVGPHGVVQLGSFELVAENVRFVADVKDLFNSFHDTSGESVGFASNGDNTELSPTDDFIGFIGLGIEEEQPPSFYDLPLPFAIKESTLPQSDAMQVLEMGMDLPYKSSWEACDFSPMSLIHEPFYQDRRFGYDDSFIVECKSSSLNPEDLLFTFSQCNYESPTLVTDLSAVSNSSNSEEKYEQHGSHCIAVGMGEEFLPEVLESTNSTTNCSVSDICTEPLVADILNAYNDGILNFTFEDHWPSNLANLTSSIPEFDKVLANEDEVEHLVESLVAEIYNVSDGGANVASATATFIGESPGNLPTSHQMQSKCQIDASYPDNLGSENHANQGLFSGNGITFTSSPTGSSSSMNGSTLINEEKPHQSELGKEKNKPKKSVLSGKKRPLPDDNNQRPRPRDRQLIQDRVKELRDLVPNGKKCSIDALLDRTIKHMVFLRSVSSQADKLRKCSRSKVLGAEHEPLDFEDENYGVTWAYELDTQPEACPIVVKDLDQQGHMLVEMLCTEYGDFLEIAQVMRRLRLTILKGVMESRAEKLWAHFVVEATKGFNRMEILWPLMQLLQQNRIPLTSRF